MALFQRFSRRSFLHRVTGGVALGSLVSIGSGYAFGQAWTGVSDSDGGTQADRAGYGRSGISPSRFSDTDGGPNADPAGQGRGNQRRSLSGVTDADSGPQADPAGNGRTGAGRDEALQAERARVAAENARIEQENQRIRDMEQERRRLEQEMQAIGGKPQP